MKVTFVYPDLNLGKFNLGIGYLSAVLKTHGHRTELIHLKDYISKERFSSLLKQSNPDLIAISSVTNMIIYARQLASWAKEVFSDTPIICGGIHSTLCPEEAIRIKDIDMICVGEGEGALLDLCDRLQDKKDITCIENIWVKKEDKIYRNPIRPLIADLDSLPFPDRDLFGRGALAEDEKLDACFAMASRGCPYNCSYCSNHALKKIYQGKGSYLRFKSVARVIEEIESVVKKYSFKAVIFHDDIIPVKKDWLSDFTIAYKTKISLPFICNLRVDLVDEQTIRLLKEAGCIQVCLGIESGNDYIRNKVMNRMISRKQILDAFRLCKEAGIKTKSFNMVGLPGEDMDKILDSISLNAQACPDIIQVSIFYPFPETQLFELCRRDNLIADKGLISYFDGSILFLPGMSPEQVYFARKHFVRMFKKYILYKKLPSFIAWPLKKLSDLKFKSKINARLYVWQRNISQRLKAGRKKTKK
jgi:anaerobic magnesium-protoporphyrin IX monomethyl ester cyclase